MKDKNREWLEVNYYIHSPVFFYHYNIMFVNEWKKISRFDTIVPI